MNENAGWLPGFAAGILLMLIIGIIWQGVPWDNAEEVLLNVDVGDYDADGQPQRVVPCTGRIRYDRTGRVHVIGGIEQTVTTEMERGENDE